MIGRVLDVWMTRAAVGFSVQSNGECWYQIGEEQMVSTFGKPSDDERRVGIEE